MAVAPAGAGCTGGAPDGGPAAGSGVRGTVVVDAGCPPTVGDTACPDNPLAARLRFVPSDGGGPVEEVRTGPDGAFSVQLPPGSYDVLADDLADRPYPRADPVTVEVVDGRFTELVVRFNSGVR